jgi:hypothetical protein
METFWRKAYELAASPEAEANELKCAGLLAREYVKLRTPRTGAEPEKYEADTAETGVKQRALLSPPEEVNPLDDEEKLRAVRIAVFGSAPEAPYLSH